ncbi:Hypothetical protein D9617_2g057410 [Elsinoe fawcettii]|nr:Hypothetical protein D9617_2g057410 [Elsinoe fawcettii]
MPLVSWCHCTSCRVGSGGLLASWLGAPQSWVTFTTRGLDDITQQHAVKDVVLGSQAVKGTSIGVYSHTSGNFRTFCTRCGSSLTFAEEEAECSRGMGALVDIATGTLDNASLDRVRADRHTWWSDGREWIMDICHRGDEKSLKHVKGTMSEDVERAAQNKR